MDTKAHKLQVLKLVRDHIQRLFRSDVSGHDWYHINRVTEMAKKIAVLEGADLYKVEMIALLHEMDDYKLFQEADHCRKYLESIELDQEEIQFLIKACDEISFKGNEVDSEPSSLEAQIVQDADRLDAIGAIGVARTFAYGGKKGQPIYDPDLEPQRHNSFESYKNSKTTTVNHFYEKLLLLKDLMNTDTGRRLAEDRHLFLEGFLDQFLKEWETVDI